MSSETDEIKEALREVSKPIPRIASKDLLSTGSTLLNLAMTGRSIGGLAKGFYYLLIGDSSSGKTFLSLTCFAEAGVNKRFRRYRLIYDAAEEGALMDLRHYFGKAVAERIEPPRVLDGEPVFSETIEDFYFNVDDAIKDGRPFIYVLDSSDALSSSDEAKKFAETKAARRRGKEAAGSYGDGKAKKNSANLRRLMRPLQQSGSILIIINQSRDDFSFGAMPGAKTRAGGRALKFYATIELWTSRVKTLKKSVRDKLVGYGIVSRIKITKNRFTGRERAVDVPILHNHGIDDVGSCVDYLLANKHWRKKKGGVIAATEFDFSGTREKLIQRIEEDADGYRELQLIVEGVWKAIDEEAIVKRKRRYE